MRSNFDQAYENLKVGIAAQHSYTSGSIVDLDAFEQENLA